MSFGYFSKEVFNLFLNIKKYIANVLGYSPFPIIVTQRNQNASSAALSLLSGKFNSKHIIHTQIYTHMHKHTISMYILVIK